MTQKDEKKICGIVMPISSIDGCNEDHWSDVQDIITQAIVGAGFTGNLVSNADEVGIIQKRIVQNLYENPIVVCDVSGKNPNVMFELGMRLAFDKPTIILKDDQTSYSFDTASIEHIEYPRDLRFAKIVEFKEMLADKIKATYEKSTNDKNYTTFLKHYGEFIVAKIDKKEVSVQEFILEELSSLKKMINRNLISQNIAHRNLREGSHINDTKDNILEYSLENMSTKDIDQIHARIKSYPGILSLNIYEDSDEHHILQITIGSRFAHRLLKDMKSLFPEIQLIGFRGN